MLAEHMPTGRATCPASAVLRQSHCLHRLSSDIEIRLATARSDFLQLLEDRAVVLLEVGIEGSDGSGVDAQQAVRLVHGRVKRLIAREDVGKSLQANRPAASKRFIQHLNGIHVAKPADLTRILAMICTQGPQTCAC